MYGAELWQHVWNGWPGAFCLKCGSPDPMEIAIGAPLFEPYEERWYSLRSYALVKLLQQCHPPSAMKIEKLLTELYAICDSIYEIETFDDFIVIEKSKPVILRPTMTRILSVDEMEVIERSGQYEFFKRGMDS